MLRRRGKTKCNGDHGLLTPQALIESIFGQTAMAAALLTPEGRIVCPNLAFQEFFGYTAEELIDTLFVNVIHPGDAPLRDVKHRRPADSGGGPPCEERRFVRKDGTIVWGRAVLSTIPAPVLPAPFGLVVIEDITERERGRETWQRSHERLNRLAGGVPAMIYQFRYYPSGRTCFLWTSPAIEHLFEVTAEEALEEAEPVYQRLHPDDRERVIALIEQSAHTLEVFHVEYRVLLPRRGLRWHLSEALPERLKDGGVLWQGVIVDVTERKRIDEAIREKEKQYRLLADNTTDAIWTTDLDLTFTYINPAITAITGYGPEEWIGAKIQERCDEVSLAKIRQVWLDALSPESGHAGVVFETELLTKGGDTVPVEVHAKPILDEGGRVTGFQGVTRDITRRKEAQERARRSEDQLRQAQKMEAIGQLAGGIAHDFNNLLTGIIGNSSLALATLASEDPNRELMADIKAAGERAAELTRQMLAFSRRQILKPQSLSLNEIVLDVQPLIRGLVRRGITVDLALEPNLWRTEVDRSQMEQVLLNLVMNACDAMPQGGCLAIETGNVHLDVGRSVAYSEVEPGLYVTLTVTDNGCGMSADTMSRIFEPFFTTKEVGKGTGLGLPTVFGIVEQSGGKVCAHSEPGRGSTFQIYLPAGRARASEWVEPSLDETSNCEKGPALLAGDGMPVAPSAP